MSEKEEKRPSYLFLIPEGEEGEFIRFFKRCAAPGLTYRIRGRQANRGGGTIQGDSKRRDGRVRMYVKRDGDYIQFTSQDERKTYLLGKDHGREEAIKDLGTIGSIPDHKCWDHAIHGKLGQYWKCGRCGKILQVG